MMKFQRTNILIYLFVSLFMFSMSNGLTINMQYGENSMYNEIEHNDCNNNTLNEIKENCKSKVCQKIPQFEFSLAKPNIQMYHYQNENLVCQFVLNFDTPPPEFVV